MNVSRCVESAVCIDGLRMAVILRDKLQSESASVGEDGAISSLRAMYSSASLSLAAI